MIVSDLLVITVDASLVDVSDSAVVVAPEVVATVLSGVPEN